MNLRSLSPRTTRETTLTNTNCERHRTALSLSTENSQLSDRYRCSTLLECCISSPTVCLFRKEWSLLRPYLAETLSEYRYRTTRPLTPRPHSTNALAQARASLADRLRSRKPELERAILTRARAIADPSQIPDPEYLPGLRRAVLAAIDRSILSVERPEQQLAPIPMPLLSQARIAGRNDVSLDTVLRRCAAGYTLVVNFMEDEAAKDGRLQNVLLRDIRSSQVALLDHLLSALSAEHSHGRRECPGSPQAILVRRIQQLLAGELIDTSEMPYNFERYHVGVVSTGDAAMDAVGSLAKAFDSRLLSIDIDNGEVWAWLGTQHELDRQRLGEFVSSTWPPAVPLALGEANNGLTGWRLTHQQAKAAFLVAPGQPSGVAQYADVALLASMSQDELLIASLKWLYLDRLADGRDGGLTLRATLRAYFASNRNSSSTAALLGVSRQTVTNRLRTIEERIGRPLIACTADLEAALRLDEDGSLDSLVYSRWTEDLVPCPTESKIPWPR